MSQRPGNPARPRAAAAPMVSAQTAHLFGWKIPDLLFHAADEEEEEEEEEEDAV